tara:strand:+ start:9952 stop:11289 length:1338 start_codon:yes stop_codon:yes gene_type:complete
MKPIILIQGPVATRSGYGDHTRDLTKSLMEIYSDKYDIKIMSMKWGECPMTGLDENNPDHQKIMSCILKTPHLPKQPEIFIQVSVPNEFQAIGKYNIGITAGIETTVCSKEWLDGVNRMDLNLVPSQHSADVFKNITFDKIDNNTKKSVGSYSLQKPVEVLFEGLDTKIYKKTKDIPNTINDTLKNINEQFAFLFVGHWLQGNPGHDRKDVHTLIDSFCEAFRSKQVKPALILKTSGAGFSIIDRNDITKKVNNIIEKYGESAPSIYLLHGDLTAEEMNGLYNHPKVKAHISFTKGEGFGRPLLEASVSQKPVIATNWSGHVDFLKHSVMLPGQVNQVHKSAVWKDVIIPESGWFYVNVNYAIKTMKQIFKHYKKYLPNARTQSKYSIENFSLDKMTVKFKEILDKYVPEPTEQVKIKLPKLNMNNSVDKKELPKVKLPKLKKVE